MDLTFLGIQFITPITYREQPGLIALLRHCFYG